VRSVAESSDRRISIFDSDQQPDRRINGLDLIPEIATKATCGVASDLYAETERIVIFVSSSPHLCRSSSPFSIASTSQAAGSYCSST
jgi:hypothetical protein